MTRIKLVMLLVSLVVVIISCRKAEEGPGDSVESEVISQSLSSSTYTVRIAGKVDASGYTPPQGASVIWNRPGSPTIIKRLNTSVSWSGQNAGDDTGYFGRYAEGDVSVRGAQIAAIGSEQKGGEASAILTVLLGRAPSNQELYDFAIANSPSAPMGCSAWTAHLGVEREGCKDVSSGGGNDRLRSQPISPQGCCSVSIPCWVNDPIRDPNRKTGEKWLEAVRTPSGGRRGCNLIKVGYPEVEETPNPVTIPTPIPTVTPIPSESQCWILKVSKDQATINSIRCPNGQ